MVQAVEDGQKASKLAALGNRIGFLPDMGRIAGLLAITFVAAMFVYTVVPFGEQTPSNISVTPQDSQPEAGSLSAECAYMLAECIGATLVDLRSATEFAEGHIRGAMHMTVREALREPVTRQQIEELAARAPVVFYCSAICASANTVVDTLGQENVKNVYALSGGFEGWQWAGLATEKAPAPGGPAD